METDGRDNKGRFAPGHRANQKAPVTKAALRRVASQDELDAILRGIVDRGLQGDQQSAEWIASRMIPPLKASHGKTSFNLDATSLDGAAVSILEAVSSGELAADVGDTLIRSLANVGALAQMKQLAQELADLKAQINTPALPGSTGVTIDQPIAWKDQW